MEDTTKIIDLFIISSCIFLLLVRNNYRVNPTIKKHNVRNKKYTSILDVSNIFIVINFSNINKKYLSDN